MKRFAISLVVGLSLAACSRDAADAVASAAAAAPTTKSSAKPTDMKPASDEKLTCSAVQTCLQKCYGADLGGCTDRCASRLAPSARPYYDKLAACVKPACVDTADAPCKEPLSMSCKMCAMSSCGSLASDCLLP